MKTIVAEDPCYIDVFNKVISHYETNRSAQYDLLAVIVNTVPEDSAMGIAARNFCKNFSNPARTSDPFLVTEFVGLKNVIAKPEVAQDKYTNTLLKEFFLELMSDVAPHIARTNSGIAYQYQST